MPVRRAMVLDRPGVPLEMLERPVPQPGPGEILIAVAACRVCCSCFAPMALRLAARWRRRSGNVGSMHGTFAVASPPETGKPAHAGPPNEVAAVPLRRRWIYARIQTREKE